MNPDAARHAAILRLSAAVAGAETEALICQAVADGLYDEALGYNFVAVLLVEEDTGDRVLTASRGWAEAPEALHIRPGEGLSELPLLDGRLHYTGEVTEDTRYLPTLNRGSEVDVPLLANEALVGVLVVESEEPNAFDEEDLEILRAAATQAGIAIGRIRLLQEANRRAAEEEALRATMADLSAQLGLSELLQSVLERAMRLLEVSHGELAIFEPDTEELVIVASLNVGKRDALGTRLRLGEGAMGAAARDREPVVISDYRAWQGRSPQYETVDFHAVLVAPLLIGGRLLGAVAIMDRDPDRHFGEADLRLLNLFAPQAAVAIDNAQLFSAERRRAEEQRALLDTLKDLSGELELSRVLQGVLERSVALLNVTGAELATWDEETGELAIVASHNMGTDAVGSRMRLGEGAMGQVAETKEPLLIPRYQEWAGRSSSYTQSTVQSVMAAPLLIGPRLVGVIASVHSDPTRVFGPEDLRLLELFAPQAAIAIENARLFTASVRQRQYLQELVRNSPVAIVTLDDEHNVVSCNPAFETLFSYTENEIRGKKLDGFITTEEKRIDAASYTEQALAATPVKIITQRRRKDGTLLDVEVLGVPVVVNGETVGLMALYHDITELLRARKAAEGANQAKSQFLANMSHELRTPLNAIIGYSEMLEEDAADGEDEAQATDLRKISAAGRHLLGLINEILDLSKIEAGKMDLYIEDFDADATLEEVMATVRPLAERSGNELTLVCPASLGTLRGDVVKTRQILLNLLSNACKFTENGQVTLEAEHVRKGVRGADAVKLTVRDSGIGMSDEQMGRLFEAFSQAEAATTRRFGGTGLGLVISRRFAHMMGGDVEVSSEPGVGSTFTVTLPATVSETPVVDLDPAREEAGTGDDPITVTEGAGSGDAGTVLIIDDDPEAHDLLRRTLTREGFRVEGALDGETGLEMAGTLQPDVLLLDVIMPDMNGWSVLGALKANPDLANIPVVVISVLDDRVTGAALGAVGHLSKPVDPKQLLNSLTQLCADRAAPILVVEDDDATRGLLRRILESDGWIVAEAENGRQAMEILPDVLPQLVVLDLMMPDMDGFETSALLRSSPEWRTLPILVLTAMELSAEQRERLSGSVDLIVHKGEAPMEDLIPDIRRALAAARARRGPDTLREQ
jgi:PAS domain S-box-containing protein